MSGLWSMHSPNLSGLSPADAAAALSQYISDVAGASLNSFDLNQISSGSSASVGANNGTADFSSKIGRPGRQVSLPAIALPAPPTIDNLNIDFDAALRQVTGVVNGLEHSWLMQYFPAAMPNGYDTLLARVLSGVIVTGTQQDILWGRAKAQTLRDAARYEDEAVNGWSSRGFSLPGGVVNNMLNMKQQAVLHEDAGLAAQQAIKALDLQVDAVKFAADKGIELQLGLINGLTGLVTAYSRLPSAASEYASAVANARRASYAAISEYYRTVIEQADVSVKVESINAENEIKSATLAAQFIGEYMKSYVGTIENAINNYAKVAGSSLSSLNSVVSIGVASAA